MNNLKPCPFCENMPKAKVTSGKICEGDYDESDL